MYRKLLLMMVMCNAAGFNIQISPVKHFTNEDPLFGQTIIQSKDGIFVPSPIYGRLFKCTLENKCTEENINDENPKGMRKVASVASLISEEEHVVMCNQVRTKKSGTEYLNGNCTLMSPSGKVKLYPAELDNTMDNNNDNNNNNNNNKYQGGRINQVKWRKRRETQPNLNAFEDEEEEEEDPGTEIAFVLDGSGSIQYDDFQKAKDFIYNVMSKVWETCFDCNFAIVQYGSSIRTELSLLDNENGARSLQKVKQIKQIYNLTKTASAINHVLTDIFIPENGSKNNSEKIIIVLSDGEILGDTMTLNEVLNKPQMKGVTRYSIGVGDGILKNHDAIEQMMQIADPGKYYNVSSYGALNDILSSLERGIIGTEGTQQGFELQLAEAGFSSHLLYNEQKVEALFGAVGAYDWSGGVFLKSGNSVKFLNDSNNETKFGYLGYSVTSAHLPSKTLYISGAPRYNLTGGVFIFDGLEQYVLQGDQVGSYFGSVLCALDINKDEHTDYLLVGAPHFHQNGEEGKVLVYKLNQEDKFEREPLELRGDAGQTFARFGAAIGSIGDIDNNKFNDVAVGAPLETDSAGSVYIYSGFEEGFRFSQKISPSDFGMKLVHFGQSVSVGPAPASDIPCIAVGSQGRVSVFKTIPVWIIKPTINPQTEIIALTNQMPEISKSLRINICFNLKKGKLRAENSETQDIDYEVDLDSGASKKRLINDTDSLIKNTFTLKPDVECFHMDVKYLGCFDCFSPIKIKLSFSLASNKNEAPLRILDAFTPTEVVKEIPFERDCKDADCKPSITLSDSKISETTITMGETQNLNINFNFTNTGDPSYMTTLTLTYPSILSQRKIEGATCPVKNDNQIQCHLQHPVFTRFAQTNLFISWQLNDKSDLKKSEIIANLTSQNNGTQLLDSRIYTFNVMYSLPIQLTGTADPNRFRIEEGGKGNTQPIKFLIQFLGENKYGATIDVIISIKNETSKTDLHITRVKPEVCVPKEINNVEEASYIYKCTLKELQQITIEANVFIHNVQGTSEKIIVVGNYSYDETIYSAKDTIRSFTVEVPITKLQVMTSKGPIIGGSIGGFLFLLIFIIILIKCGFFRRRHKLDQTQNQD